MKKFGLFISIALLTAFVGCDSDDVEDPVVPAVSKPVVAVSENTPTSFGVEWDAVDKAAGYQYVVTESDAAGNTSEFCPETQTDKTSLRFDDAAAGAKYTVKVKALAAADSQLADSEYAEIFVETPGRGTFVADVRLHGRRPRGVRLRDGEGRAVDRRRDLFLRRGEEFAAAGQEQQRHYRNAQKGYRTGVAGQGRTDDRDEMARSPKPPMWP